MTIKNEKGSKGSKSIKDLKDLKDLSFIKETEQMSGHEHTDDISVSIKVGNTEIPITPDTPDGSIDIGAMLDEAIDVSESIVDRIVNECRDAEAPQEKADPATGKCSSSDSSETMPEKDTRFIKGLCDQAVIFEAIAASYINVLTQPFGFAAAKKAVAKLI